MPNSADDTLHDFIANFPVYRRLHFARYVDDEAAWSRALNFVTSILRYCSHEKCKAERPFHLAAKRVGLSNSPGPVYARNVYTVLYKCTHCASPFWCSIEASEDEWSIRKVGQFPPYDISVAPDLRDALGDDAMLYKRAQICMSQSFGIAACSYLRRLLEEQITPLLQLVYEVRKEEGEDVGELSEILDERVAEKKIRLANNVLPSSLEVPGDHPLELIYNKLSAGLHRQSEQECMEIATEASELLRYVVISINDQYERRQSKNRFTDLIKGLRKRGD